MRSGLWKVMGGWLLLATVAGAAGPFVAPAEGPVPFRRDRVPLDVGAMTGLSRSLTLLSHALDAEKPADRRALAQTLALAIALDPSNREARGVIAAFQEDGKLPPADAPAMQEAAARLWSVLDWLASPAAGPDGQALAACLTDVAVRLDPAHPQAKEHEKETGAWAGWVAELASYQPKEVAPDPVAKRAASDFVHATGKIFTPLHTTGSKVANASVFRIARIDMQTSIQKGDGRTPPGFEVDIRVGPEGEPNENAYEAVTRMLETMGDVFPKGGRISLISDGEVPSTINPKAVSAAAALLIDSAVSHREPEVTVMGIIADNGAFKLPPRAWDRLRALSAGPGGRLVLPREAESLLPPLLTMGNAGFFAKYEVILAGSLQELIERSDKNAKGPLADASARFREVRSRQGAMAVEQYVANSFVRRRLGDIGQLYPDLASARLLEIQGSGRRPALLPRRILASEMRLAMEPLGAAIIKGFEINSETVDGLSEKCRTGLDALERYTEINDRELDGRSRETLVLLRNLMKARRTGDYLTPWNALKNNYEALRRYLDGLAGDEDPPEPKEPTKLPSEKR